MEHVAIAGAGSWGTALAVACRRAGRRVTLWGRDAGQMAALAGKRENPRYLPGIALDPEILISADPDALTEADACLLVVPAQVLRATLGQLAPRLKPSLPLVLCAKGIEQQSGLLMTEVAAACLPDNPLAVLSGPTFAAEVARGLPTAVTLASTDANLARTLAQAIGGRSFRPYVSDDPLGAEIGGAVKNVLAIACGIVAGRRLGDNAGAALITRGLAEMTRLCLARGGKAETMMGLAGLGDLTLSCTARQSRNFSLGLALGEGQDLDAALKASRGVVEGRFSAAAVLAMAEGLGIELPICQAVDQVVNQGTDLAATIDRLLARPFKAEGFSA
ncbi:NAD(P)-dependent glycerol-3-phosphate dehydrogenase [Pelagibius litoralis]|uniref:Glycerol-3-phosphate dehydrogenase [NAD(P)+] n=1 Tax=Pelagibius litoralis TaxID=374515 RepID=A0A967F107_9PROT|nr:NAD(P)H-dependent glycerol-3-phosphate dehydrogenase [Pelagibius litoralis]NIA71044.1 NAD(P)-dependent glycerol-3-phosphate dehydrogenase [Pelagibius litoralis]